MQLLADLVPGPPRRFAVMLNPKTVKPDAIRRTLTPLEATLGPIVQVEVSAAADLDSAFKAFAREGVTGLVVLADATLYAIRHDIGRRCQAMRLPSVWGGRGYLDAGGVASYQGDLRPLYRRSAVSWCSTICSNA